MAKPRVGRCRERRRSAAPGEMLKRCSHSSRQSSARRSRRSRRRWPASCQCSRRRRGASSEEKRDCAMELCSCCGFTTPSLVFYVGSSFCQKPQRPKLELALMSWPTIASFLYASTSSHFFPPLHHNHEPPRKPERRGRAVVRAPQNPPESPLHRSVALCLRSRVRRASPGI